MQMFSFHLLETSPATTIGCFLSPPAKRQVKGLRHLECLSAMELGSPIFSLGRFQLHKLALFARWDNEAALDSFLVNSKLGRQLSEGWHIRLEFLRRWGQLQELNDLPCNAGPSDSQSPVVAVTLARLKLTQLVRFIRWGKPVEELVRDHSGTTLALAAIRLPHTFSTFTIWRTQQDMTNMVHGRGSSPGSSRHAAAMEERNRKDFHYEFITLRFRAISEHGNWQGRNCFVPDAPIVNE